MVTQHHPEPYHRRSVRLKGYDYAQVGAYFVTVCTYQRENLFGEIVDGAMRLNDYGQIARREWSQTGGLRPNMTLDAFVVMPNHVHAIVVLTDRRGVLQYAPTEMPWASAGRPGLRSPSQTLGAIIRGFKGAAAKRINALRHTPGFPVWQRNYYEHVVRDDEDLDRIREYIACNPARWADDANNPLNVMRLGIRSEALPRPRDVT